MIKTDIRILCRCLVAILVIFPLGVRGQTGIPRTVSHQGLLLDPSTGNPVADASYDVTFRLYESSSGGSAIWTETQSLTTSNGVFNAILGSVAPLTSVMFNGELWLSHQVAPDAEISERTRLTSVPYAMGLALPFADTVTSAEPLLRLANTGTGPALFLENAGSQPAAFVKDGRIEVEFNSTLGNPHVLLRETSANDYARLSMRNDDNANYWDIAAGGPDNNLLNFFRNGTGDIMTLQNTGRVGIGTLSPDTKLEVAGVIKADSIVYSSPLQQHASVHGSAFLPLRQDGTINYLRFNGGFYFNGGNVQAALASIQFPHNATLETLTCRILDSTSAEDLNCKLCREVGNACFGLAEVDSSGDGGDDTYSAPVASLHTVDNQTESFFLVVSTTGGTNWTTHASSLIIRGVSVGYTVGGGP